jgi:hypothetical protein
VKSSEQSSRKAPKSNIQTKRLPCMSTLPQSHARFLNRGGQSSRRKAERTLLKNRLSAVDVDLWLHDLEVLLLLRCEIQEKRN